MQQYKEYSPTAFDPKGAFLHDDRAEWSVLPLIRTRDTGYFEESNFEAALAILGGESNNVEVHRFGHWGPGWFEIIIVNPNSPEYDKAVDIEKRLESYTLLDESDYCQREFDEYQESWEQYAADDFRRKLHGAFELDFLPYCDNILDLVDNSALMEFWEELHQNGEFFIPEGGGLYFDIDRTVEQLTATEFAAFIRKNRRGAIATSK